MEQPTQKIRDNLIALPRIYITVSAIFVAWLLIFNAGAAVADKHISDDSRKLLKALVETNSGNENLAGQEQMRAFCDSRISNRSVSIPF